MFLAPFQSHTLNIRLPSDKESDPLTYMLIEYSADTLKQLYPTYSDAPYFSQAP